MNNSKQDTPLPKHEFSVYRNSEDGKQEKEVIWQELQKYFSEKTDDYILDAGCGEGWLLEKLKNTSSNLFACDISKVLLEEGSKKYPFAQFTIADLTKQLPYEKSFFDTIVWNLGAHDVENLTESYTNLFEILKPEGQLLLTVANPYYSFPVGNWKKGIKKILFWTKPELKLKPYNFFKENNTFTWLNNQKAFFRTLPEYINLGTDAGFRLIKFSEISCPKDSKKFNRCFQMHRFPMVLLLVFKKPLK